jgi:hypothetical protein
MEWDRGKHVQELCKHARMHSAKLDIVSHPHGTTTRKRRAEHMQQGSPRKTGKICNRRWAKTACSSPAGFLPAGSETLMQ